MKTMELGAEGVESSGSLVIQGEDLLAKLTQVDRSRRLILRAKGFPSRFELPLIGPLLDRYARGWIVDRLLDNMPGRRGERETVFERSEGSREMLVDLFVTLAS